MAKRPDLDALIVPKGSESAPSAPVESGGKSYTHTLSLRLTTEDYRRLRRFVADLEEKTGKRATQQAIIEAALNEYISTH
jgi:hypothetical protein